MPRRTSLVPDLFHVKRTIVTNSPPSIHTEICGTYTDLDSAQTAGLHRLEDEGYPRSVLNEYAENDLTSPLSSSWRYGQNVLVHARKGDEIHDVEIQSTPNSLGVRSKPFDGRVWDNLFYLLRTIQSRSGSVHTEIRGIYLSKQAAVSAARHELVSGEHRQDWYQEYSEAPVAAQDDDMASQFVVSALGQDGVRYVMSVTHET
ncbi:hypothetical protein A1O1_08103 [Capronia coronata CBS 617.96]|uniref:Uncharacterized protein n=1 Tax=Capronia coronata CBS 617.96 TaxID=1182541 RepID=W9XXE5_9EURO|nr:uncharacterized protein A1O1_08103 [Capronia coronata CBS 617.96]EXJ82035.1 hypothetical protein A1O1_08103 [Capronia coronata CBS 617.96]